MNYNLLSTVQQTNIRGVLAAVVCSSSGGGGGGGTWGSITGTLSNQTDLQTALDDKVSLTTVQVANTIFAGPTIGADASPSFRSLVSADIPNLSSTYMPIAGATTSGFTLTNGTTAGQTIKFGSRLNRATISIVNGSGAPPTNGYISIAANNSGGTIAYSLNFDPNNESGVGAGIIFTNSGSNVTLPQYAADYSASFTARNWVDKGYVDSVAGGWAVTGSTTITGNTTQTGAFTNTFALNGILITQNALSSGWVPSLKITPGAHTAITATTEKVSLDILGATQTWNSGTTATQRMNYFRSYTLAGTSATATFTNAYGVYIEKPVAGTNAAIINSWALGVDGAIQGPSNFDLYAGSTARFRISTTGFFQFGTAGAAPLLSPTADGTTTSLASGTGWAMLSAGAGSLTRTGAYSMNSNFAYSVSGAGDQGAFKSWDGFAPTSTSAATFSAFSAVNTINMGASTTGLVTIFNASPVLTNVQNGIVGFMYNPSVTSVTGIHYAMRAVKGDISIEDSARGLILKDTAGTPHYWRVTISTLGVLTTTDLGTSLP